MAGITDSSGIAGGLAVNATSKAARVELFDGLGNALTHRDGAASVTTDEAILVAGTNEGNIRTLRVDRLGNLSGSNPTSLLTEPFEGATLSVYRWAALATTMAGNQTAAAGHLLNSGAITTINTGYAIKSLRAFANRQRSPLHLRARARINHFANSQAEIGFGDLTAATGAHTNGAYWQYTTGGVVQPVLMYNTQEIPGTAVTGLNPANYYTWDIIIANDAILFTIQDTSTGTTVAERSIQLPSTQPKQFAATRLFAFARVFNSASAPASASQMIVSSIDVLQLEAQTTKPWKEQMAESGYGAGVNPVTFAIDNNFVNNTAATLATLSNTTASYATRGGYFHFAAIAGANTDYALFAYQSPAPYAFICTGIDIETWNLGAAVATTPHLLVWAIAYDLVAATLVSTGPRTVVGSQDFAIGAVVGARATSITKMFDVPFPTNPGRFIDVVLRMPVATATASQLIHGHVSLRGYYA
jgi:hypothetical protein